jgi:hypothetical protein
MLKKYLYRILFLIAWGIILSPLNTFAGTLTNISIVGGSTAPSATTTYTVSFTTENAVPAGAFSAFQWAMNLSGGSNNFDFNNVGTADVTLTVNGVSRAISAVASSNTVLHIYPSGSLPAGANLVFTVNDVINPNAAGSYTFFDFRTRTTGTDPIDTGNPSPIVIVNPDTTTQAPTLSSPISDSVQNTLQLTYSLPEVPTPGTVNVSFNNGTTTTTLTMGNSQSVDTAVNLVSLASTSGVASATAGSLADGTYTVTLSYQDYLGNPMSTDVSSNVIIDTTAPVITAINSSILFPPGAAITWTTNEASSSRVEYGLTTWYGTFTTLDSSLVTAHTVNVVGLAQVTPYNYRVISVDAAGNSATSGDNTFTTSGAGSGGIGGGPYEERKEERLVEEEEKTVQTAPVNLPTTNNLENNQKVSVEPATQEDTKTLDNSPVASYLTSFIKFRAKNNPEDVKKLQIFLNDFEWENLPIDGIYKREDVEAIKRFQKKYTQEILAYWNITEPTGYVYIKTVEMINKKFLEKKA